MSAHRELKEIVEKHDAAAPPSAGKPAFWVLGVKASFLRELIAEWEELRAKLPVVPQEE